MATESAKNTKRGVCVALHMTEECLPVYAVCTRPTSFTSRSGLYPLCEAVGASACVYRNIRRDIERRSWTAAHLLQRWGQWHYRSEWNSLLPLYHDAWLRRAIPRGRCIAHFLFAEFAAPRNPRTLQRRGATVIGTFHASTRRQERINGHMPLRQYDWLTVVSRAQIPWFLEHGIPEERLRVTQHGVDTDYFRPPDAGERRADDRTRLLLVGSTERDHDFMAQVCSRLDPSRFHVRVLTGKPNREPYRAARCVETPGHVPDEDLVREYQQADLMVMPMMDCTANNAILESMACGTPVMANRVGGIPEYLDGKACILMKSKVEDDWVDRLLAFRLERDEWPVRRAEVRRWAERFSWEAVAIQFQAVYAEASATAH